MRCGLMRSGRDQSVAINVLWFTNDGEDRYEEVRCGKDPCVESRYGAARYGEGSAWRCSDDT